MSRETETLAHFPYVAVRMACRQCERRGEYRLARLAAKYGLDITLDDLLLQLVADCPNWVKNARLPEGCGAYFADLEYPRRPPDLPRAPLRSIKGGKAS